MTANKKSHFLTFLTVGLAKFFSVFISIFYTFYIINKYPNNESSLYWQLLSFSYITSIFFRFGSELKSYQISVRQPQIHIPPEVLFLISISALISLLYYYFLSLILLVGTENNILISAKNSVFAAEMFAVSIIISEFLKGKGKFYISLYLYSSIYQICMLILSYTKTDLLFAHNFSAATNLIFSIIALTSHLNRESFLILPRKKWMQTISSSLSFIIITASHQFIAWSGTIFISLTSTPSNVNTFQVFLRISGMYLFVVNTTDQIFAKNLVKNLENITSKVYSIYKYSCILSFLGTTTITGLIYAIHQFSMPQVHSLNQIRQIPILYFLLFGSLISATPTFTNYLMINKRENLFARNILLSCVTLILIYTSISLLKFHFFEATIFGYMISILLYRSLNILSGREISRTK
ncbi:hypothetical protein COO20_07270 [Thalassospira marina]|uniref:Uncharacterized protein n=1 Tax=Thalassospira marina TaxID=2048283 RepID=A0A2N3KVQ9_9PROT|nr:hypothetical protein COO20_07270 [Thalassospira marina]